MHREDRTATMPNAPSDGATIPLHQLLGIEFPVAFNEVTTE
ncbi:MAG: hypothetical protein V7L20_02985 [Nostoc sp.]